MAADRITITPTVGVAVHARDLASANETMALQAAGANQWWPADVRFAARPGCVIAVPDTAVELDGVVATLRDAGARVIATAAVSFDDADALVVPTGTTFTDDACAVAVADVTVLARPFDDAVAFDIAAMLSSVEAPVHVWPLAAADHSELAVFGAHLRGGPLVHQLTDFGARWAGELTTAARYRMSVLPTNPPKPAVTRVSDGVAGTALLGHRWLLSPAALGRFLAALPAPMQLGKVEFDDGTWRTGFGCDGSAATGRDISSYRSWPAAIAAGAV